MAKTFNRAPLQVNTPSSSDVKNYFFNHYNWKGVNRDKNFLTVDQETFADAKNVYVDGEGILRSRPSIKKSSLEGYGENAKILDIQSFGDIDLVVVYLSNMNQTAVNVYRDNDHVTSFMIAPGEISTNSFKLLYVNDVVYVFSETSLFGYDIKNNVRLNPSDCIYVPNTTVDASGVKTKVEGKNILTDKEVITYLYQQDLGISVEAYGKELSVTIDDDIYNVIFDVDTKLRLTGKVFDAPDGYKCIDVSNNNSFLLYNENTRTLVYNATGKTFTKEINLPDGNISRLPKFTNDSNCITCIIDQRVYILSVVESETVFFNQFTDVGEYFKLEYIPTERQSIENIDAYFDSYNTFVIRCNYRDTSVINLSSIDSGIYFTVFNNGTPNSFDAPMYSYNGLLDEEYSLLCYDSEFLWSDGYKGAVFSWVIVDDGDTIDHFVYVTNEDGTKLKLFSGTAFLSEYIPVDCKIVNNNIKLLIYDTDTEEYALLYSDGVTWRYSASVFGTVSGLKPMGIISNDGVRFLTEFGVYNGNKNISQLRTGLLPLAFTNRTFYTNADYSIVYSNDFTDTLEFKYYTTGDDNYIKPSIISQLSAYYFAKDSTLYIGNLIDDDGVFKWYLPYENKHEFDGNITNIQPISTTSMSVFLNNNLYYVDQVENAYTVTKSKLTFGLLKDGDVITSYEGDRVFFCTERGFVALSYQDFVASTDQTITVLSDAIHDEMNEYCKEPVKLFKYDFWIILYKINTSKAFVFDTRNGSWWPIDSGKMIQKIFKFKKKLYLLSDKIYQLDTSHANYYDFDDKEIPIEWYATSQKLYLSASNYYKHIINITLSSITDNANELTFDLDVVNYRRDVDIAKMQQLRYKVKTIRTFVKRLNYSKVTEFQYTLSSDNDNSIRLPLSVSDITIKYKITGQVR